MWVRGQASDGRSVTVLEHRSQATFDEADDVREVLLILILEPACCCPFCSFGEWADEAGMQVSHDAWENCKRLWREDW